MRRSTVVLVAVPAVVASLLAGFGTWYFTRAEEPTPPQISAYSNGHLTHVGPYLYCDALDLEACLLSESQGTLSVDERHPVQLSVDDRIGRAPWRLVRVYDDPGDTTGQIFPPGSTLAVTVPTMDPHRGPLRGLAVQLLTMVRDRDTGDTFAIPHAEWAVGLHWNRQSRTG
ncbi:MULTISPECIES: DUF2771 domain-containing protein [Mycolicibacter]|uniref:DUF2771 domain-containing protein n=1 Tax=[Mycobacterium] vasticus TaxID=2875777 RepID=A0ABU5YYH8_9MYCO|nr:MULTISPECIES: DUF2771 domain-containing protein [unclassified Mycolicibacter]MEB3064418.1 DUF2771 domain-containing protein [Mycolicibacter sp. MYC101]MEB3070194.1 DUF2771 domain-containing protein [Mycolicibacter sp. MYC017]